MEPNDRIEDDYENNQKDPAPSEPAVKEKDDKPASRVLNWVTIIAVVILTIIIFLYYY